MDDAPPAGWVMDSPTLFLHADGARIERRVYRDKEGWALVPADLDRDVQVFPPDDAGRAAAFAVFAETAPKPRRGKAARP